MIKTENNMVDEAIVDAVEYTLHCVQWSVTNTDQNIGTVQVKA